MLEKNKEAMFVIHIKHQSILEAAIAISAVL